MAVKFIFEDGENTPSSILLKQSYYGKYIYFSNGVSKLLDTAIAIKNAEDIVYMFYDVSPNNRITVKGYETLVDMLKQNKKLYKDIYVIPIICIEYHICKILDKDHCLYTKDKKALEMIEKIVRDFDWETLSPYIKNDTYIGESLEHAYKNIISLLAMRCMRNEFEYVGKTNERRPESIWGIFYEKDCICERKYCNIDCSDSLEIKAEKLYRSLPIIVLKINKKLLSDLDDKIPFLSNAEIVIERRYFYKKICTNMKLPMPSIYM